MSLESATYIWELVPTNPEGSDPVTEGDNHLRMLKATLQASFPGMTAPWTVGQPIKAADPVDPQDLVTLNYYQTNQPSTDPIGHPRIWFLPDLPGSNYIDFEGQALDRVEYATLFALYGTRYGAGNGVSTFNVPDMRGMFMRVWNHGGTGDPDAASRTNRGDGTTGDNVGTRQADEFKSHQHTYTAASSTPNGGDGGSSRAIPSAQSTGATGGAETRPVNVYIRVICRAK